MSIFTIEIFAPESPEKESKILRLKSEDPNFQQLLAGIDECKYEKIIVNGDVPSSDTIGKFYSALQPSGKLSLSVSQSNTEDLILGLQIAGFNKVELDTNVGTAKVICEKPSWFTGDKAAIRGKVLNSTTNWKVLSNESDVELISEEDLLNTSIEVIKPSSCGISEPGEISRKKACKNCTCGLADQEENGVRVELNLDEKLLKSSACGNCSKGDAFRCAGCPFLGKPAFEPGSEKVVLSLTDDI